jgi:hypothetical protein
MMFLTRYVRFMTPGIVFYPFCKTFDRRCDVYDSFCEVCDARCYVFDSFCGIFDFRYDIETRVTFLTAGIMLFIRSEIFYPRFNVCD